MKRSKIKILFVSLLCLIVGFAVGFAGSIFVSLPDSYKIPDKIASSNNTTMVSASETDKSIIESSGFSIHFLELGNKYAGDCIYIKIGDDIDILIDGGSKSSSIPYIEEYVDQYIVDALDFVIVTHAHEDHYAGYATAMGTDSLFDYYGGKGTPIGTIVTFAKTNKNSSNKMYANYTRELNEAILAGAKHYSALDCYNETNGAEKNYTFKVDGGDDVTLQFLYQKYYVDHSTTENNYSVCFQLIQGNKKYLFTGDLEEDGEISLVENNDLSQVELYKAGHHGSKTSSSETLMAVVKPKIVVVCCVSGSSEYTSTNANQFPTQQFVNNVSIYTNLIYVTTLCIDYKSNSFESMNGTITICSSGSNTETKVMCSNNSTVLKDTEWFASNRTLPEGAK